MDRNTEYEFVVNIAKLQRLYEPEYFYDTTLRLMVLFSIKDVGT
jgi:hypothetical protein